MGKGRISNGAGALLIALSGMTNAFSVMPGSDAGSWVWVSDIIASILALLVVFFLSFVCDAFSEKSFYGVVKSLMGKKTGSAIGFVFVALTLLSCVVSLTVFSRFVRLTALPQTPQIILPLLLIIVSAFSLSRGAESISGSARLLFVFVFAVFVFFLISGVPQVEKSLVLPQGKGVSKLFAGAGEIFLNRFGYIPAFMAIYTRMSEKKTRRKYALIPVAVVGVALAILSAITVSTLGEGTAKVDFYPIYTVMSLHAIGGFIQHTEIFACIAMVLCLYFKCSVCLIFCDDLLGEIFNTEKEYGVYLPLALICAASTQIIYKDVSSLRTLLEWKSAAGVILALNIIIPLSLFVICLLKKKKTN